MSLPNWSDVECCVWFCFQLSGWITISSLRLSCTQALQVTVKAWFFYCLISLPYELCGYISSVCLFNSAHQLTPSHLITFVHYTIDFVRSSLSVYSGKSRFELVLCTVLFPGNYSLTVFSCLSHSYFRVSFIFVTRYAFCTWQPNRTPSVTETAMAATWEHLSVNEAMVV